MMDPEQLLRCAIALVRAMMSSASTEKIRRIEWWSRAKSALETAAQSADSFGSLVSVMGRKLQIDVTTTHTAQEVAALASRVSDFEAFRHYVEHEALYVVAIAQAESAERKAVRGAAGDVVDHYGTPNLQPEE
jgi:hypothetical protein